MNMVLNTRKCCENQATLLYWWAIYATLLCVPVMSQETDHGKILGRASVATESDGLLSEAYVSFGYGRPQIDPMNALMTQAVDLPLVPGNEMQPRRRIIAFNFDPILSPHDIFIDGEPGSKVNGPKRNTQYKFESKEERQNEENSGESGDKSGVIDEIDDWFPNGEEVHVPASAGKADSSFTFQPITTETCAEESAQSTAEGATDRTREKGSLKRSEGDVSSTLQDDTFSSTGEERDATRTSLHPNNIEATQMEDVGEFDGSRDELPTDCSGQCEGLDGATHGTGEREEYNREINGEQRIERDVDEKKEEFSYSVNDVETVVVESHESDNGTLLTKPIPQHDAETEQTIHDDYGRKEISAENMMPLLSKTENLIVEDGSHPPPDIAFIDEQNKGENQLGQKFSDHSLSSHSEKQDMTGDSSEESRDSPRVSGDDHRDETNAIASNDGPSPLPVSGNVSDAVGSDTMKPSNGNMSSLQRDDVHQNGRNNVTSADVTTKSAEPSENIESDVKEEVLTGADAENATETNVSSLLPIELETSGESRERNDMTNQTGPDDRNESINGKKVEDEEGGSREMDVSLLSSVLATQDPEEELSSFGQDFQGTNEDEENGDNASVVASGVLDSAALPDGNALVYREIVSGTETREQKPLETELNEAAMVADDDTVSSSSASLLIDQSKHSSTSSLDGLSTSDSVPHADEQGTNPSTSAFKESPPTDQIETTYPGGNRKPSVNDEFVLGLDDLHKFVEEVDPPDELDVGAAGSSMQEVLMGQGVQILKKRVSLGVERVQRTVARLKRKTRGRRGDERQKGSNSPLSDRRNADGVKTGGGPLNFAVVAVEKNKERLERASRAIRKACARYAEQCRNIFRNLFGAGEDEDEDDDDMSDLIKRLNTMKTETENRQRDVLQGEKGSTGATQEWNVGMKEKSESFGDAKNRLSPEELQKLISQSQQYSRNTGFSASKTQ